jgi:GntR family transcriptional regulator / MocR family aminotransferase
VVSSPRHGISWSAVASLRDSRSRAGRCTGAGFIAVEDPCFAPHRHVLAMSGLEVVPIPGDAGGMDVAALTTASVDAVLVVPAHSYPAGVTLSHDRRQALIAWATAHNAVIIEDDYDSEFRYDRAPVGALQGLSPAYVVCLGSVSKTIGPSLRIGWVAASNDFIAELTEEKQVDDMGSSLIEQLALARFVDSGDFARYLRRVRPIYRDRRDAATRAAAELLPEASWSGAAAGLHLHLILPDDVDERAMTEAAHDHGVLIEHASMHWANQDLVRPSIVLGYGPHPEAAFRRAVSLLANAMASSRGHRLAG